jgi:hypothetical protein
MASTSSNRGGLLAGLLALAAFQGVGLARPAAGPRARPAPYPLVVTIVVDQMAAWMAAERWPALPADGGFARLRREGLTVRKLRYEHAVTETAPGHAALYTGAVPRVNGIFANDFFPSGGAGPRSILADDETHVVGVRLGVSKPTGSSLAQLRVETVADVFEHDVDGAQVYSFSLKDRGALFGAGNHPTAALWLDTGLQEFVTSSKLPAPPPWLAPLGDAAAVARARQDGWKLSDADRAWVAAHAETPDDQPGEGDYLAMGTTFPHVIGSAKAARATPVGDALLFDLARGAVKVIAASGRPALLALSLSSHDYVMHTFGPHSWEAWAELLLLDRRLGQFLAELDGAVGKDRYAVLLTGDHGGTALPELSAVTAGGDPWCRHAGARAGKDDPWDRACEPRRRLLAKDVAARIEAALVPKWGPGPWIAGVAAPLVYLTPRGHARSLADRATLLAAAAEATRDQGIDEIVDTRAATAPCPTPADTRAAVVCRAIFPDGPAELYLVVRRGVFFDPDLAIAKGENHGSPYLYDRTVPLLLRAPGRVPPGRVRATPVSFAAFARTAASLLGVHAPAAAQPAEDLSASR